MVIAIHPGPVLLDLSEAASLLAKLKWLDQFWSGWAGVFATDPPATTDPKKVDPKKVPPEEFAALTDQLGLLVDGIERTFQQFAAVAARLEPFFAQSADILRQPPDKLAEQLPEKSRAQVRRVLTSKGDPADAVRAACANMGNTARSEITQMRGEVDKIAGGGTSDGDYSVEAEGDLALVAAGIAVVAGPGGAAIFEGIVHTPGVGQSIGEAIVSAVEGIGDFIVGLFS